MVVGLDLCPFARAPLRDDRIRFVLSRATEPIEILAEIVEEIAQIEAGTAETSLIVVPELLADFEEQLDLLAAAEALLADLDLEGRYQLVTFHPDYRFADAAPGDPADYTNRSPYPLFHVLRWADVARAAATHPDVHTIPERNIQRLRAMGADVLAEMLSAITALRGAS